MCIRDSNTFAVETGGSQRFKIDSNGNVTVNGDTNFNNTTNLDVRGGTSAISDGGQIMTIGNESIAQAGTQLAFGIKEDDYTWIRSYESGVGARDLVLAAGAEALRITSAGNIGIGITNPDNNLQIFTNAHGEGLTIKSTGNTSNALTFDANRGTGGVIGVVYGRWNGTTVGQMSFISGEDGTDKNDGYITFGTESAASNGNVNATERLRIDGNGFIRQQFTSDNSTTAEGFEINNMNNGTGNNASLIFSNDSGTRKKAAIAHIDMGNYGHGDFVFALDGGDSGSLHLTNDERVRIRPSGVDYTLKVKGADQVEGYSCDTWSASLYLSSGTTHTICTMSTGNSDSQVVATMDYSSLYSYASNNRYGGQIMAIARKTSSNTSAEATNNIDAAAGGSDSNIKPSFFWDVSTPGAIALKVTTGSSVQVVGRIQVTYKDTWTLTRNYSAE